MIVVVVVFLWGSFQSFWNLGAANFNADEPIYRTAGWAYVHGDFSLNREHPPTAKYIIGLAQLVLGEGQLAARVAVALVAVLGGVIIYFWLRKEVGWQGAAFAAAGWLLLPHGVESGTRLDRFAVLEPFMVFFAIAAFAAGWRWFRTRSWLWLVVSAVAMALSVTSKVSSIVLVPAILLLPLLERRVRDAIMGGLAFLAVFAVGFVLLYLPMGIRSAIGYMLSMQSEHNAAGHSVNVGGVVYTHPPWWSNLLFSVEGMGIVATTLLIVAGAFAFVRRPRALTIFLSAGLVLLFVFYLFISTIALAHYYYAWVWILCVLAGIGFSHLVASRPPGRARVVTRSLSFLLVGVLTACALSASVAISSERPTDMALVLPTLSELDPDAPGSILVAGMAGWEYEPYLASRQVNDPAAPGIVAIATRENPRFPLGDALKQYLHDHDQELRKLILDDVTLYINDKAISASNEVGTGERHGSGPALP